MSAHDSTQWFWSDWAGDPCVRRLTPAERGLWIDLLCLAAVGNPTGYVSDYRGNPLSNEEIARFTNASPTEVGSLIVGILEKGAASRDRTGRLFNRRMVRKIELSVKRKRVGVLGGEATRLKWQALQNYAGQTPRDLVRTREPPLSISKKETTTSSVVEGQGPGNEEQAAKPPLVASPHLLAVLNKRPH